MVPAFKESTMGIWEQHLIHAEVAGQHPDRMITFACFDPRRANAVELLERAVVELGMVGLKIHPAAGFFPNEKMVYPMYEKAMEYAPRFDVPHLNLAQLLLGAGREEEALDQFREAAQLNPFNYIALANLGVKAYKDQNLQPATALFDRAIRVREDYAIAHKYLGLIYAERERPIASVRHLERSLEIDGRQPEAGNMRLLLEEMKRRANTPS